MAKSLWVGRKNLRVVLALGSVRLCVVGGLEKSQMYKRLYQIRAFGYLAPPEMRTHIGLLCQLALNRQRAKQKPLRALFASVLLVLAFCKPALVSACFKKWVFSGFCLAKAGAKVLVRKSGGWLAVLCHN